MAIGFCRLSRDEFYAMTPKEFNQRMKADVDRDNRQVERIAQLACWVINPWLGQGKSITTRDLLGKKKRRKAEDD